ncbi:hypothetical protein GCM10028895_39640 [Pontibacter rugosus]
MFYNLIKVAKPSILAVLLVFAASAMAQDGTIYPLKALAEPNAILLGTGGVDGQKAPETWFRQWGDPMARNISTATLTPSYLHLARLLARPSLWHPAEVTAGFR